MPRALPTRAHQRRKALTVLAALLAPAAALADDLSCAAVTACRGSACRPVAEDVGVRVAPMGAGMAALGMASDGPLVEVTRDVTANGLVRFATRDGAEELLVRPKDMSFTYRRSSATPPLEFRGTCSES